MADIKINVFLVSRRLKTLQQSAYAPVRKKTGLNQMELQIIFTLNQVKKNVTVGDIHNLTDFNKGQISVSVSSLIKEGYITVLKSKKSQYDTYKLTEKGLKVAKEIEKNTATGRKILFEGFSDEELMKVKEFFDRMKANVERHEENGDVEFK